MEPTIELEASLDKVCNQAEKLGDRDPSKAIQLCVDAINNSKKIKAPSRSLNNQLGRIKLLLSHLYIRVTAYDHALTSALEANAIYKTVQLESGTARSLNAIGLANIHLGTYAEALDNLLKAVKLAEKLNDARLQIQALNNLGVLYIRMEDYQKALTFLQQGADLTPNFEHEKADLYNNICLAFLHSGKYNQALTHGQKAIALQEQSRDCISLSKAYNTTGQVYAAMGHSMEALNYFHHSLSQCETEQDIRGTARSHYLIGSLLYRQGETDEALKNLHLALRYAEQGNSTTLAYQALHTLYQIYRELEKYQDALIYFEKYHQIKEVVFDEDMTTKIKSLEILHEVKETQQNSEIYRLKNVELTREIEERKKIQAELERIITLDPLTSLFNRRHFFELTQNELDRSRRYNRPISIIMLDIDHFKQVNDRFGHLVGDRVIVEVAQRVKKALRRIDLACRYGGEEFAILLPETNIRQAEMVANRLWQLVTKQPTVSGELKLKITVSVGVATYQLKGLITVDTLLDRADQAMYQAKQAGRNQVMVYSKETNGDSNS